MVQNLCSRLFQAAAYIYLEIYILINSSFAYFVHRGQSKARPIFSCINGPNIARREKDQSIVHKDRTCEVLSCSIVSCQIGGKVGTSIFVEEKAGIFTTNLSMSKFLSVFNERNYILPKNLQLRLFFTNLFSKRRQLCHHFSGVYISACLCCTNRRRLIPGPRHAK